MTGNLVHSGNQTFYYINGRKQTKYFLQQNGKVYYFGDNGAMYQNRFYSNWGRVYYFGNDGARYTNQWYSNWGYKYYFGSDGARLTDQFLTQNGKVYYFEKNDGIMYQNRWYSNWGHKYYFGADGARYTDQFLTQNGKVYYFEKNDGIMYQNQWYSNWGHKYYFGADGARYTDQFLTQNGKVFYFAKSTGVMYQNQWYFNWGHQYYFGTDGARYTNQNGFIDGVKWLFDTNGIANKAWTVFNIDKYSDDPEYSNKVDVIHKYLYFAIKSDTRTDGIYVNAPYMTDINAQMVTTTKPYHGVVVYADQEETVTDTNGTNHIYVHVNLNDHWYWMDKLGLTYDKANDEKSSMYAVFPYNCYDANGLIPYYSDSKFSSELDAAAQEWNNALGTPVFIKKSSRYFNDLKLYVYDTTLNNKTLMSTLYGRGLMLVNSKLIGNPAGFTDFASIKNTFVHELGHALGLNHTYETGQSWSWSIPEDVMASKTPNTLAKSKIITKTDINTAHLIRKLRIFPNCANPSIQFNAASDELPGDDYDGIAIDTLTD